ncbi:hypothetical protein NQ038_03945 [Brevibacterium sp. 50QC2O2]|uniref:hypothetical protein n=1 Tax=Brevibacterium TaxID=1696 RepID=UPI00211C195C|nr:MULTISPECIES: hypothetical protein [unclassified Brevibacterium]MCQ9385171.1 hypothetical protein [Brevibacterium sp. 68QC2CO]MCQ9387794.1 hypothetical protein [Brevibacterium sp. 50QC2O2]
MRNVFTAEQATAVGIRHEALRRGLRCCLSHVARGAYIVLAECTGHPEFHRFIDDSAMLEIVRKLSANRSDTGLRARFWAGVHVGLVQVVSGIRDSDVVSHESAALVHGIPILQARPGHVTVSSPDRSRTQAVLRRRQRDIPSAQVLGWGQLKVTDPVRTAVDLAADISLEAGVIALDHLLRGAPDAGGVRGQLALIVESDWRLSHSRRVRTCLSLATGLAESPGESLCLVRFYECGMVPVVEQQVPIYDRHGALIARVDFRVNGTTIIEVDGAAKYKTVEQGGYRRAGEDPLLAEKRRQHRLEAEGYRVERPMWAEVVDPSTFKRRMRDLGLLP